MTTGVSLTPDWIHPSRMSFPGEEKFGLSGGTLGALVGKLSLKLTDRCLFPGSPPSDPCLRCS
jgi:hypothetical protein